ncbi:MAG TPA: hypothetical protein VFC17_03065 [Candidatus Limnocylindrales bacterium]|nr:hypothetical protein [Candidatus Limnocylindrales bacterium]
MKLKLLAGALVLGAFIFNAAAWDYEGHHAVNELALAALPANFPAFVLTPETRDRIAFLAGEADRWRNETSLKNDTGLTLGHVSGPDHYLDMEDLKLYGLTPATLPPLRYDFVADIVKARAAHPEKFPAIDPAKDSDHTRELSGFLPWAVTENYQKLQSGFATLAALEKFGGTPVEIANAKQDIVYVMGVMGHYVGDASQPLHTTMYHHGWTTNDNPNHYSTAFGIHAWIDGGFFKKTGGLDVKKMSAKIHPAEKIPAVSDPDGIFHTAVNFVAENNQLVEPLYKLDRDGKLSNNGDAGAEGRALLEGQLVKSGQLLGDLWFTAWATAPEDTFLERELQQRAVAATNAPAAPANLRTP